MIRALIVCSVFFCQISIADTLTLKNWGSNSLKQLSTQYQQRPFLLVFWSLECPACYKEFEALSTWKKNHHNSHLVIVSTDPLDMEDEVKNVLVEYELTQSDVWIFSNEPSAKIRNSIDSTWFGELPRSYFFDTQHQSHAHSGALTSTQLKKWQSFIMKKATKNAH